MRPPRLLLLVTWAVCTAALAWSCAWDVLPRNYGHGWWLAFDLPILLVLQLDFMQMWCGGVPELLARCLRHRDVVIGGELYLRRHFLTPRGWRLPRVFLHWIRLPDAGRDPHDHPWSFWTIPLLRWYREDVFVPGYLTNYVTGRARDLPIPVGGTHGNNLVRWLPRWRRAEHIHGVREVADGGCWTLVVAWPPHRRWGFWTQDRGWEDAELVRGIPLEEEDRIR